VFHGWNAKRKSEGSKKARLKNVGNDDVLIVVKVVDEY
jgi:hypothetical protein